MRNLGEKIVFISRMKKRGFVIKFSKNGGVVGKKSGFKTALRGEKELINKPLNSQNLKSNFIFGLGRVWS
ncbi:hypothetical protein [Campylobacter ureolyticus]|uniref:hypothetical protein n=1 Tax=Campylobacter ureolyticus TaxID=827 RepID=UPI0022B4262B|nr:hypothetical protein [Campylobacter ureolyticus]MCI6988341.1 hypothetical protein [Campylobacter sp.]MCZ6156982.1 hypothetical protein [Campylobacter ureolyticus]MCZ6168624.1 hypothetical protein [Campylobacter ureolyticus]